MNKWVQPPPDRAPIEARLRQAETRLRIPASRIKAWRARTANHYPLTVRTVAIGGPILGAIVGAAVMLLGGAPIPAALTLGPVLGALTLMLFVWLPAVSLFDPLWTGPCQCAECKSDLR